MSSGISFDDYLITFQVRFQRNLRRSVNRTVSRLRKTPEEITKSMQKIRVASLESGGLPITFRVSLKIPKRKWEVLAQETVKLRDDLFASGQGKSLLGEQVEASLDTVFTNVAQRFVTASLDVITGQLVDAMEAQSPVTEEFQTTGIKGAIGNIPILNSKTQPYSINKETGAVTSRPSPSQYSYRTATGQSVDASGYWAFLEFGTSNGVTPRSFLLGMSREIHLEDEKAMNRVNVWLKKRIDAYNKRAKEIMG